MLPNRGRRGREERTAESGTTGQKAQLAFDPMREKTTTTIMKELTLQRDLCIYWEYVWFICFKFGILSPCQEHLLRPDCLGIKTKFFMWLYSTQLNDSQPLLCVFHASSAKLAARLKKNNVSGSSEII